MENVSRLILPQRSLWKIEINPYLYDHHLEGNAVFPAAEAAIELAKVIKINFPQASINNMTDASFPRFLPIPDNADEITVFVNMEKGDDTEVTASLLSTLKSKTGNISRTVEHARVKFSSVAENHCVAHPFDCVEKLDGECIDVPVAAIYRDLVPFGRAYRNIYGDLTVSRTGALGYISGDNAVADDELLGSPFPFDAVLQMACIWAQRFTDIVPFPVGFVQRIIYRKTKKQTKYLGRIAPVAVAPQPLVFNAWIFDQQGAVYEIIQGIRMRDVSRGRMKPPAWIKATTS
ncbi:MAG: polyketide synthase dehydratase domain-containing protein [Smithella sp.]